MKTCLQIHPSDDAAVAPMAVSAGETVLVGSQEILAAEDIPAGHKLALHDLDRDQLVYKYGFPIGRTRAPIKAGSHIHCHNLASAMETSAEYRYTPEFTDLPACTPRSFPGFRREDGRVGIRNEIWIIPTVGCVNAIASAIAEGSRGFADGSVDGVYAYSHPYGCSQLGEDQALTQQLLCGLIRHPNAGGVLVLSLGCENNNLEQMKPVLGEVDPRRVKFLVCQDVEDEVSEGVRLVQELCSYAKTFERTGCSASDLVLGLKCGGSDGFSGITANPLVGRLSDCVLSMGGSAILTEVPEMFGAETILMDRCRNRAVFDRTVQLIQNFKDYFLRYGEPVDENPSPGNKAGGISTLAEKSLGCIQKGGMAPVEDVLRYGEPVKKKGLSLLQAPGNDLVASCALAASGAQLVLFTTGRGTPFGCPVPTMKISSNSALAARKNSWIDFDAGQLLDGMTPEDGTAALLDQILAIAGGTPVKSEKLDKHDLAIFKDGVTL